MVDSATLGYLEILGFGLVVSIILLFVFCILRPKVPDVYEHRALLNTWQCYDDYNGARVGVVLPRPDGSFLGWLKPIFSVSEEEVIRKVGLDAAIFLRYLWTCFRIVVIISLFATFLLMPVYGTGSNKGKLVEKEIDGENRTVPLVEGLKVISLANVPEKDGRLWATVVMEFIVAAVVIYFMSIDYSKFANLRREYLISETPANYAIVVYDVPEAERSEVAIRDRFEMLVPGQVSEVILIKQCTSARKLQKKLDTAVMKRELAEYIKETKGESPETRPGFCGCLMCHKPKVDALEYWKGEQNRLASDIIELGSTEKHCPSAIVLFSNKRAAALLTQANIATSATNWSVERAPHPEGVNWPAFAVPGYQAEVRAFLVFVFVILFTTFWTIPAAFIAGLFSIQGMVDNDAFSWASFLLDLSPAVTALIDSVLPAVVMSVLISLIPPLFRFVVGKERISSLAVVERKTRDYFYFFTLYGSFFIIVLGQAVLMDLEGIADDPVQLVDALARNVPGSGLFFGTFILVQALIPLPLQLSGVVRVIVRWIMLKLAKTERQKRKARSGGSLFQFFRYFGQAMLVMFLCVMFSSLNPIVPISGVLYFGLALMAFRYMLCFTTHAPWEGGGELFTGSYWGTMFGLMLKQLVTILVLGLKEAPGPAIVCVIPLVITFGLTFVVAKRYKTISDHGSLYDLFDSASKHNEVPSQYKVVYEQPSGHQEEYENLNGLEEIKGVYPEVQYDDLDPLDGVHSEHHDANVGYVPDRAADRAEV